MYDPARLKSAGFSLTELFPVVAILGALGAIVVPQISGSHAVGWQQQVHEHYASSINMAVERYHAETGTWPELDLSDIARHPDYFPEGIPHNPVTGTPYVLNPETYRVE